MVYYLHTVNPSDTEIIPHAASSLPFSLFLLSPLPFFLFPLHRHTHTHRQLDFGGIRVHSSLLLPPVASLLIILLRPVPRSEMEEKEGGGRTDRRLRERKRLEKRHGLKNSKGEKEEA